MKRVLIYITGILLITGLEISPFRSTDVGKLLPVELVRVSQGPEGIRLETDTGNAGAGEDVAAALKDLKATASGTVFLDTADYLLVVPGAESVLQELTRYLRPTCGLCLENGEADLEDAAEFLRAHEPNTNLQAWQIGERGIPLLSTEKERMKLVQS